MSDRGFYVGYLPLPQRHKRALTVLLPLLVIGVGALGAAIASAQRDPGDGVWNTGEIREWEGVLVSAPYPILIDDTGSALLIVEQGKFAPRSAIGALAPARVRLSGWAIERDGRRMIELEPGKNAFERLGDAEPITASATGEPVTLRGEILDSKCYLGAMKPGDGKAHKACATLCIEGGIPPMLFSRTENGTIAHHLLVDTSGETARDLVLPYVGEPVTVTGMPARLADLDVLLVSTIERAPR